MNIVIFLRGRNTEAIRSEFLLAHGAADVEMFVCRKHDPLALPGDKSAAETIEVLRSLAQERPTQDNPRPEQPRVTLVANGGTTEQLVVLLDYLLKGWNGWHGSLRVFDTQKETSIALVTRPALEWWDKPVEQLSRDEMEFHFENTPW